MKKSKQDKEQQFFVIKQLVSREIKRKYARSYLGVVWSVLNPLLSMAVLSMIFSTMFKKSIENYPIYYLTGMMIWQFFSTATDSAMSALVDNRQLLLRAKLTKNTFVISRVYTALVNLAYTSVAYLVMLLIFRIKLTPFILLLPICIFFLALFGLGLSYVLSIVYVFFADVKHLYSVLLMLWMYMSAIFYPIDFVSGVMKTVIEANPVYAYINFARTCVLQGQCPSLALWLQVIIWGVVMFVVGHLVFKSKENLVMHKI